MFVLCLSLADMIWILFCVPFQVWCVVLTFYIETFRVRADLFRFLTFLDLKSGNSQYKTIQRVLTCAITLKIIFNAPPKTRHLSTLFRGGYLAASFVR